ncbi:dihydrolipoamide acetyltransferase family protein [Effusibacillus pohliae]|uniref:dihydrolipoamide acetyltransferase family protein n=1 Tax=Effusibacillus pohliae TaxID=232270 RepID=UPI000365B233|nr:dihydrolipoamide acetyltransferase family protein [Effusibacillus pohliae]
MAEIKMPQLGESVTEGTIAKWLKQPGDRINKYDPLCEVITDKVNAEVPSDFAGVLTKILVHEGETVPVGTVIAVVEEVGAEVPAEEAKAAPAAAAVGAAAEGVAAEPAAVADRGNAATVFAAADGEARARFSPAVMRLLQEHNLDPSQIKGTGAGGRITRKDVLAFIEQGGAAQRLIKTEEDLSSVAVPTKPATGSVPVQVAAPKTTVETGDERPANGATVAAPAAKPAERLAEEGDTVIPVTPIRATIAKRMVESKHTAPHAWTMVEADVTSLVKFRESVKDEFKRKEGISLTFLPFFIKAVVESLKEFPVLNSTWAGDKIIIKKRINISIAVATDDALFVPVIKDADRMSILGLAHAIHELAAKARAGKLAPDDISGGTFTVNNTGAFGSILSQPIINSPQAAILSMESIVKRPVVLENDAIAIRSMVNLCLSLDHRVLDGLVCGKFLTAVKQRLESFDGSKVSLY